MASQGHQLPPCNHAIVVDEPVEECLRVEGWHADPRWALRRRCLLCGFYYHRTAVVENLRGGIAARYRLPPSPWSAEERAEDC